MIVCDGIRSRGKDREAVNSRGCSGRLRCQVRLNDEVRTNFGPTDTNDDDLVREKLMLIEDEVEVVVMSILGRLIVGEAVY